MSLRITRIESVRAAIKRVTRRRIERATALLERAPAAKVNAGIHEARKQIRRVRALLKLIRLDSGRKPTARANTLLQNVARALSAVRDGRVLLATARELHASGAIGHQSFSRLRIALETRCERAQAELFSAQGQKRLTSSLRKSRKLVTRGASVGRGWKALDIGLHRTYRAGRAAAAAIAIRQSDEVLHEARKRAKDLLYVLDFLQALQPRSMRAAAAMAGQFTELLGVDHDLAVFQQALRRELKGLIRPAERVRLNRILAGRRKSLQLQAHAVGLRLYPESADDFVRRIHGFWKHWRHH
jgi:CHAD domain-containing protein